MVDATVIVAIVGAIEAVIVAFIGRSQARTNKRNDEAAAERKKLEAEREKLEDEREKAREEREKAREDRDACIYDLVFATASGTEVLLHQAHGEQLNGNVDEALGQLQHAKAECNHEFNRQTAKL